MLPSVAPTVLIFAAVNRKSATQGNHAAPTSIFVSGYLVLWILFSLLATIVQWGTGPRAALLSPMMVANSASLGAGLLVAAGVYQWLPIKDRCLRQCRSPVDFITTHWRAGVPGAFRMGLSHGVYCLGCCWVLMSLLFVGGVMNLLWIAAITLFVLLEKNSTVGRCRGSRDGHFDDRGRGNYRVYGELTFIASLVGEFRKLNFRYSQADVFFYIFLFHKINIHKVVRKTSQLIQS